MKNINAVTVKFKKGTYLYPKDYVFKIHVSQAKNIEIGQTVFVKDRHGKRVPVVVQKLLELAPAICRKHKPILHS